jgi:hypothetical protein
MKSYSVIVSLMAAFAVGAPLEATNSNATVSNSNGTDTEIVPQAVSLPPTPISLLSSPL